MTSKSIVLDDSILVAYDKLVSKITKKYEKIIIPIVVIEKLQRMKSKFGTTAYMTASRALKDIEHNYSKVVVDMNQRVLHQFTMYDEGDSTYARYRNIILSCCVLHNASIATNSLSMQMYADYSDINVEAYTEDNLYYGYQRVYLENEAIAKLYSDVSQNTYNLLTNQYLLVYDEDKNFVDKFKWNGVSVERVLHHSIESMHFGNIRANDTYQNCALDSFVNNDITVLYGKAGTGKSLLSLSYLMSQLEQGKISKIYIVHSYDTLKGAKTLGYEKGSHEDKLLMSGAIGNILSSKFGDMNAVLDLIHSNSIEIIPTANIRGVEFRSDAAVYITEAQNLDTYTMKTIVQRCASGCKQIYEGDIVEQTDVDIKDFGLRRLIDVFKGTVHFGCVKLKQNYRNVVSDIADLM